MLRFPASDSFRFDRVGMRFETSQTTPSYLDRRVQLRMLSFVGLISLVMITLSVMNNRPAAVRDGSRLQQAESLASVSYEARLEPRTLAPDEFIIPAGFEDNSDQAGSGSDDQGLFKSRSQEQAEGHGLFSQRKRTSKNRNEIQQPVGSSFDDVMDDNDVDLPANNLPESLRQNRRDQVEDTEPFPANDRPIADDRPIAEDLPVDDAPIATRTDGTPRRGNLVPDIDFGSITEPDDDPPLSDPVNRRREKDLWIPGPSDADTDAEPFREDIASVGIKKDFLDVVRDNEVGIRRDEAPVFYWLLDHARRVSSTKLEKAGLREVQYINLMNDPDRFRGEPITIEGDLWRLDEFDAGRNDYGVSRMYQGWVFTGDSGNHPYRIVCTSLGKGIQPGENLRKPVRITGYFFKREAYQSNGGIHIAPTLLARRIAINPMPNGIPMMSGVLPYMFGAVMAVGLGLLVTIVAFAVGDERSTRAGMSRLRRQPHISFAELAVPSPISIEASLREFAERERLSAISGAYGPLLSRQTARDHAVHDYATSRKILADAGQQQHLRQTDVLQDWAARQKEAQAEIDALKTGGALQTIDADFDGDELSSDKLSPARNFLPKAKTVPQPVLAPRSFAPPKSTPAHLIPTHPHVSHEAFVESIPVAANPHPVVSQIHSVITHSPATSSVSYGASKLSEYEDEVAKMTNRDSSRSHTNHLGSSTPELSAAAQIERDRLAREQEIRQQIHRQHAESERLRLHDLEQVRLEQQRLDHERSERERHQHEERDRIARERHAFDRTHHTTETQHASRSLLPDPFEHERLERERLEREHHERERLAREHAALDRSGSTSHSHHSFSIGEHHPHERHEHERHEHEHEHDRAETQDEFDRYTEPTEEYTTDDVNALNESERIEREKHHNSGKRRGNWGWPKRRKNADVADATGETEVPSSDETSNDGTTGQSPTGTSSGWGRSRKKRRNWREGESA